jgi:hypothetical protein
MIFLLNIAIVNGQQTPPKLGYAKMAFLKPTNFSTFSTIGQSKSKSFLMAQPDSTKVKFAPTSISSTYYTEHLGMMCKEELKLEKAIKFPVKIRLGSKEEVDYLEGKYNQH